MATMPCSLENKHRSVTAPLVMRHTYSCIVHTKENNSESACADRCQGESELGVLIWSPDPDDFLNVTQTFLPQDTSLVKMSRISDQ